MNIERWEALLRALGAGADAQTFARLEAAYGERHRAYHTARHINDCLGLLDEFKSLAAHPEEVECALWFHDAIYQPRSNTNEERSADWAVQFCENAGVRGEKTERIRAHILATRHVGVAENEDGHLVVDIDLSILGTDTARYAEFEREVRKEYKWVPGLLFRRERAKILRSFLDRPRIYHWQPVHERFERQARINVESAIKALRGKAG